MNQKLLTSLSPLINLFVITFFVNIAKRALCIDPYFLACNPSSCGDGQNISFPFYIQHKQEPFCGYPGFQLSCNINGKPILQLSGNDYIIHEIFYNSQSLLVSNAALLLDANTTTCLPPIQNTSLADERFTLSPNQTDLLLYNCNQTLVANNSIFLSYKVNCSSENQTTDSTTLALFKDSPELDYVSRECNSNPVVAPVNIEDRANITNGIKGLLQRGFLLNWVASDCGICEASGGKCGFNNTMYHFRCFCPDRPHAWHCTTGNDKWKLPLGLGLGIGGLVLIIIIVVLVLRHDNKRRRFSSNLLSTNSSSDPSSKADLEGSFYYGVHMFSYGELEEATNNFDAEKELGDGGFGTVYLGKLRDGREVAVKRLYEHNYKRFEQFRNEIEILTRLRHKNLVTLYGCTSRRSRELLLVYEYIPNGTVADHLHGDRAKPGFLAWPIRMSIAIETASALAYLHASDIIHRDVKTNNILLDNNFCVKVADFGLSRLFPLDVTHVSTAPQGTPGYVDPEYHQCYQLTDKSDVYSFGVVLIELISSMPAVDITRHRSEINLANLAINKIQKCEFDELIDPCLGYKSDEEVKRMTILVAELAFRCLQQNKEMRPSMEEVLEELQSIRSAENEDNKREVDNDNKGSMSMPTPTSPLNCDEATLLKNIQLPPSPITVTSKWPSSCSSTPNVSC